MPWSKTWEDAEISEIGVTGPNTINGLIFRQYFESLKKVGYDPENMLNTNPYLHDLAL